MYFKRIGESLQPTYYLTNSTGQFVASIKKLDADNPSSWKVAVGPEKKEEVKITGLTMEQAFDYALNLEVG